MIANGPDDAGFGSRERQDFIFVAKRTKPAPRPTETSIQKLPGFFPGSKATGA